MHIGDVYIIRERNIKENVAEENGDTGGIIRGYKRRKKEKEKEREREEEG